MMRVSFGRLQWIVLGVVLALVIGWSRPGVGTANAIAGTPVASPGATPMATISLGKVDPASLLRALQSTQPPASILPDGQVPVQVYPWGDMDDEDLVGTLGGAIMATEDPFSSDISRAISYVVFPDEAGATESYASIADLTGADGVTVTPISPEQSGGLPATIIAFEEQTICVVQVEYVLVVALIVPTDDPGADVDAVTGFANAGITHLLDVVDG